jgi:hypothetical protein
MQHVAGPTVFQFARPCRALHLKLPFSSIHKPPFLPVTESPQIDKIGPPSSWPSQRCPWDAGIFPQATACTLSPSNRFNFARPERKVVEEAVRFRVYIQPHPASRCSSLLVSAAAALSSPARAASGAQSRRRRTDPICSSAPERHAMDCTSVPDPAHSKTVRAFALAERVG